MRIFFGVISVILTVCLVFHYDLETVPASLMGFGLGSASQQIAGLFE